MKKSFSLRFAARLLLLIAAIVFLSLFLFVKVGGERYNTFFFIGLFLTSLSNIIGIGMR